MFEKQQRILGTSNYSTARKLMSIKIRDSLERIELNVISCLEYLFLNQQFITRNVVVDRGSYKVTTCIERKEKE